MEPRPHLAVALGATAALVVLVAAPVAASPALVTGCPPCGDGFVRGAAAHGVETGVAHGEATVRVHENGSATWTVRVVPTSESALNRLAENGTLARAVAADSFGVRYGGGIDHELLGADVVDGAFVIRYRTLDVARSGPFGTTLFTYFRDSPGAYVYTGLGADEVTVIAPPGTTVASGFGDVAGDRMTATELPDVRDGPFVVFAPEGSVAPGLRGTLAVVGALGGVIVRNAAYFVALPGAVLVGGIAAVRRALAPGAGRDPTRLGGIVAAGGALAIAGAVASEAGALPAVTGNLLLGGFVGAVLVALGAGVGVPRTRRRLSGARLAVAGVAVAAAGLVLAGEVVGAGDLHRRLAVAAGVLPAAVALGWADARDAAGDGSRGDRLFVAVSAAIVGALVASAPLTALGGTLFLLVAILLTVAAVGIVAVSAPLYLLGAAGAGAGD